MWNVILYYHLLLLLYAVDECFLLGWYLIGFSTVLLGIGASGCALEVLGTNFLGVI